MSEDDARTSIEADLRRVADRLRGAPELRVEKAAPAARAVLQRLADVAHGVDARAASAAPQWRAVPELPLGALGDQLAVLGSDLVRAVQDVPDDEPVWARDGRQPLAADLAGLAAELRALRMSL